MCGAVTRGFWEEDAGNYQPRGGHRPGAGGGRGHSRACPGGRLGHHADVFCGQAGALNISAPASVTLGSVSAGALPVSGQIGNVTVTDNLGLLIGLWTASVTSTATVSVGLGAPLSASWNPTVQVNLPGSVTAGTYTATITHSLA